ncbi:MAG: GNAT family N-acetyltransferase [Planctomycetota bacterium]
MNDSARRLERWTPGHTEADRFDAACAVKDRAYAEMMSPRSPEEAEARRSRQRGTWTSGDGGAPHAMLHVLLDGDQPVAVATTFARTIVTEAGPLDVLALSGVAVDPDRQRAGLGERVVRDAFQRIGELGVPLSLYQTGLARGFYEKLGARCVDNWFFDSKAKAPKANPWFDRYVMIYPAEAPWPAGSIDLGGPAY